MLRVHMNHQYRGNSMVCEATSWQWLLTRNAVITCYKHGINVHSDAATTTSSISESWLLQSHNWTTCSEHEKCIHHRAQPYNICMHSHCSVSAALTIDTLSDNITYSLYIYMYTQVLPRKTIINALRYISAFYCICINPNHWA